MASTFGGLTSLSRRSIWLDNFSEVEQMIGKTQICLGKKFVSSNLQEEIALKSDGLGTVQGKSYLDDGRRVGPTRIRKGLQQLVRTGSVRRS
jgi:hypothetical protein